MATTATPSKAQFIKGIVTRVQADSVKAERKKALKKAIAVAEAELASVPKLQKKIRDTKYRLKKSVKSTSPALYSNLATDDLGNPLLQYAAPVYTIDPNAGPAPIGRQLGMDIHYNSVMEADEDQEGYEMVIDPKRPHSNSDNIDDRYLTLGESVADSFTPREIKVIHEEIPEEQDFTLDYGKSVEPPPTILKRLQNWWNS